MSLRGETSDWAPVVSRIPQGSVLGPTLFIVFVNDLPECVHSMVKLFADDAKIYTAAKLQSSRDQLQADLWALGDWSLKWLMPFNDAKCKSLHLGSANPHQQYTLGNSVLEQVISEKDLGVYVDQELKFREQAASAVSRATQVLGLIRRSFEHLDTRTIPLLYKTLV